MSWLQTVRESPVYKAIADISLLHWVYTIAPSSVIGFLAGWVARMRGLPLDKMLLVGFSVTVLCLITIHLFLSLLRRSSHSLPTGGTHLNQDRATNSPIQTGDHSTVTYNLGNPESDAKQIAVLDEIKKLIENQSQGINEKNLLKKYPLGYVIFDIDRKNHVIPYAAHTILDKYELNWSGVGVYEPFTGSIEVKLPSLKSKDGSVAIASGVTGGPKRVGELGGYCANDLQIWAEILAIGKDGIVFLIGFERFLMPHLAP